MNDVLLLKKQMRKVFADKRKSMNSTDRESADKLLFEKTVALDAYKNAKILLAYYPVKGEPNILPVVEHALKSGKRVAFPISEPQGIVLTFAFVKGLEDLAEGTY